MCHHFSFVRSFSAKQGLCPSDADPFYVSSSAEISVKTEGKFMLTKENQSQPRTYKIYLPHEKQWVEVTEPQYYAYYREIWTTRKRAQKHRQCMCPKSKLWLCDGDCIVCRFHAPGDNLSLDLTFENEDGA